METWSVERALSSRHGSDSSHGLARPYRMASPVRTGGGRSLSDVPTLAKPFKIETEVDVVQPAGSYSATYTVGRLSATTVEGGATSVEIISTAATGPTRYRLPDPFPGFTELVIPLLNVPDVRFTVRTYTPEQRAVTRALIVVEPLRDTLSDPSRLRKLFASSCSELCKRRQRARRAREASEQQGEKDRPRVELLPELVRKVIGMLPGKDRLTSARRVNRTWTIEADATTPPTSYTARVHKHCRGRSEKKNAGRNAPFSQGTPPVNPTPSPSAAASQPLSSSTHPLSAGTEPPSAGREPPPPGGTGGSSSNSSGEEAAAPLGRDVLPSASWLKEARFTEYPGEEVLGLFEAAVSSLERMALDEEGDELCLAAVESESGDGGGIDVNREGEARVQCRRLRSFLGGVRALCPQLGISCGGAESLGEAATRSRHTAAENVNVNVVSPPFGLRASREVVAAVSAAAAAAAARTAEASGGRTPSARPDVGGGGDPHRWDGWRVFALAIVLASSEDRPFLCRCALQSVWGGAGLPRTEMVELLCKAYVALRPAVVKANEPAAAAGGMGFQAASEVSTADTWDGTGSFRLRNDLLQCIYALENYFVRFVRTPETAEDEDDGVGLSQSSSCSQMADPRPKLVDASMLTNEQRAVVNTHVEKGETLKVVACAGTGKTTTMKAVAEMRPEFKILYLAFNSSVAAKARQEFPRHVDCRTMNSVSMMGGGFSGSLQSNIKAEMYAYLKLRDPTVPYAHVMVAHRALVWFYQSDAPMITMDHIWIPPPTPPSPYKSSSRSQKAIKPPTESWVLQAARDVWEMVSSGRFPGTFDSVLKAFQLSGPDLSQRYDMILLDEAQDINGCQADIIKRQKNCRVIVVGDPHQAIYGWRGAKDYLKQANCFKELRLTQCFRFGTGIASVGNTLLLKLMREKRPLLGSLAYSDGPAKVLFEQDRDEWFQLSSVDRGIYVYIARTNAGLIKEAIASIGRGDRVAVQGGADKLELKDVRDVCYMMMGDLRRVKNPELKEMGSIAMLRKVLEDTDDAEIRAVGRKLNMVEDLMVRGRTPQQILADVKNVGNMTLATDSPGPLMILTTVHKAKGLEFDTVVLANDFTFEPLVGGRNDLRGAGENANLLYVAVTRAKRQLFLNRSLAGQLRRFRMWDSLALQGTSSDQGLRLSHPAPCHGHGCECADARGVAGGGGGGGEGEGVSQATRLFYAGSGSIKPLCRACVEGVAGEEEDQGGFPYARELFTSRGGTI